MALDCFDYRLECQYVKTGKQEFFQGIIKSILARKKQSGMREVPILAPFLFSFLLFLALDIKCR
jgi:hypothetical protein